MSMAFLVPVMIGVVAVLQAILNRQVARQWGLSPAVALNMVVALSLALGFLAYASLRGAGLGIFRVHFEPSLFRWWWLLPGCFGCLIVLGLPWAVEKLGASTVFVAVVAAQMATSALWDRLGEGQPLSVSRALGALLAVLSAVLVTWK